MPQAPGPAGIWEVNLSPPGLAPCGCTHLGLWDRVSGCRNRPPQHPPQVPASPVRGVPPGARPQGGGSLALSARLCVVSLHLRVLLHLGVLSQNHSRPASPWALALQTPVWLTAQHFWSPLRAESPPGSRRLRLGQASPAPHATVGGHGGLRRGWSKEPAHLSLGVRPVESPPHETATSFLISPVGVWGLGGSGCGRGTAGTTRSFPGAQARGEKCDGAGRESAVLGPRKEAQPRSWGN